MQILVTGGAGFIGSHIVEELLARHPGSRIRILDNLSSGKEANLAHLGGRFELLRGDIRDESAVARAVSGVEIVFHLAAMTSVPQSVADPAACTEVNVLGTVRLLEAARKAGVKKFLFASSSAVYGASPVSPKAETLPTEPISPYGVSKLAGEEYCLTYARLHGLTTVSFRYFNVFGPRQDPNSQYAAVIPKFAQALISGKAPQIYGDGEQTRDFVFVKDVAQANLRAAFQEVKPGAIFNVGRGESLSLNQLLGVFARVMNRDPKPVHTQAQPGDIKHSLADISRIRKELGYAPTVSIEEGLRLLIASAPA